MTLEEKIERVRNLRPIDDILFEVLAGNKEVCTEILQTILEDKKLNVEDVIVQSSERNLYGKSVRLDALCTLGDGTKCNIEVQRSNNDNHLKRARYNASSITVKDSRTGERYEDILELYIVYISEFDFLKGGLTTYHIDKVIRENGQIIDDGLHEIFVNTTIDDGTDIADLMSCFTKKEVNNPKFPKLSKEVTELKSIDGRVSAMSEIMEELLAEGRKEGRKEGLMDGMRQQIYEFISEGIVMPLVGADKLNITVEELKERMKKEGYSFPK